MCCTNSISTKETWRMEDVNRFLSYQDEVLCDVIPMDICHMLLGRLWQFNRHDVHDGRANTYTLTKDGVKHKLKPLQETNEVVCRLLEYVLLMGKIS